jgi:hypothetical protein
MAKKRAPQGRYCTRTDAGAMTFVLRSLTKNWRNAREDQWYGVDLKRAYCGRKVGTKTIAGEKLDVVQVGHAFYAERSPRRAP